MNSPPTSGYPAFVVQNLNADPRLPFADGEFDAAGLCVSIDYLTDPVAVLRETARVLRAGAPMVSDVLQPLLSHQGRRGLARAGRRGKVRIGPCLFPQRR